MGGDSGLMDGGSQSHQSAYPVHEVTVDSFWIDEKPVTNQQFAEFVDATGYVTFAERPLPEETIAEMQKMAEESIRELEKLAEGATGRDKEGILDSIERIKEASKATETYGSIVFVPPDSEIYNPNDITQWWRIEPGANWKTPNGPGSSWEDFADHPVVNVTHEDATAYAEWTGKRLPTEAEWERAARGGHDHKMYVWGDEFAPEGEDFWMANIWQGEWPYGNTEEDGFHSTSPVGTFPPNDFGLYDMAGNVWEITADLYHPRTFAMRFGTEVVNPTGPHPDAIARLGQRVPTYVTKGGSFLCSAGWCSGYQPGSRQAFENDSPSNHTGFRTARDVQTEDPS